MLVPMIGSMATSDKEMGTRIGICFTFTGAKRRLSCYISLLITNLSGIGGLVGTPIAGALLTSQFIWWRPVLFSGLCVIAGSSCFILSRVLLGRARGTHRV
jgi:hypothetical protein